MIFKTSFWSVIIFFLLSSSNILEAQQIIEQINYDKNKGYFIIEYRYEEDDINETEIGTLMPGNHVDPEISANTEKLNSGEYVYSYIVRNGINAFQPLFKFALKTESKIKKIKEPDSQWDGAYIKWKSELSWAKHGGKILGIKKNESVSGFSFESPDLPTILNNYSNNYIWMSFPGEEPVGRLEVVVDSLLEGKRFVITKTIGPRKLPDDLENSALLDTLESYLTFSCDTTWIENRGICRSLEAKLENMKRQLNRGNNNSAANVLQAFLNEVEALREKQISSEAYALLYFNGKHLMERFQGGGE